MYMIATMCSLSLNLFSGCIYEGTSNIQLNTIAKYMEN